MLKQKLILMAAAGAVVGASLGIIGGFVAASSPTPFYDGEGNAIPLAAVQALVKDQFVLPSKQEYELIRSSFYFYDKPEMGDNYLLFYDMPEEMAAAEVGAKLIVLGRDTVRDAITYNIGFYHQNQP